MQLIRIDWTRWGELVLFVIASIDSVVLFVIGRSMNIYVMYIGYIIYRVLYHMMITIAQ